MWRGRIREDSGGLCVIADKFANTATFTVAVEDFVYASDAGKYNGSGGLVRA